MRVMLLALCVCSLAGSVAAQSADVEKFDAAVFTDRDGAQLPYRLLRPSPIGAGTKYPLVVQLHGSGAIGTDNRGQIGAFSNGWLHADVRTRFRTFLLVPQFPARTVEYPPGSDPLQLRSNTTRWFDAAIRLVEKVSAEQPIDRSRIYVVGFSMGASTALQAILARPDLFAAAVAIAPVPPAGTRVPSRPILVLHGDADTENPFTASQQWSSQMKERGAAIEFRAYKGLQHELPPDAVTGTWWREWLFAKRLSR